MWAYPPAVRMQAVLTKTEKKTIGREKQQRGAVQSDWKVYNVEK